jgi:hypothetical protein
MVLRRFPVVVVTLLTVVCASPPAIAQTVTIMERDPAPGVALSLDEALFVRLTYTSDTPLRFQASGYRGGTVLEKDVRMNPAPVYPAGSGEAVVWISYGTPATVDELRVEVYDSRFQLLSSLRHRVDAEWRQNAAVPRVRAAWVDRLNGAQQQMISVALQDDGSDSLLWMLLFQVIGLSIPGYFILQFWTWRRWAGGWWVLGLLPLIVTVPVGVYTLFALAAGSNLWPLLMIFTLPCAFAYLAVAGLARFAMKRE